MKLSEKATLLVTLDLERDDDVSRLRRAVARYADELGFGDLDRTRLITATSELARNMLTYAGGGRALLERLDRDNGETALKVSFDDLGPGIDDVEQALLDGYSTGQGLGLGLGGARRLVDDFQIHSKSGEGTRIAIARWLKTAPAPRRAVGR
jgi:serine/threonine-protein kinase RsbT